MRVTYSVSDYGLSLKDDDLEIGARFRFSADAIVVSKEVELLDVSNAIVPGTDVLEGTRYVEVRLFNPTMVKVEP